tara:strand:+ start:12518 stop:12778 length:261 start_codon:yes stop_codon:yes gene_type:complete
MEKQYFDLIEFDDDHIWAVDKINNIKAPVDIKCLGHDDSDGKVVLQQDSGGWWYSRDTFKLQEAKDFMDRILKEVSELSRKKYIIS